ncbi:hypothetical protein ACS0TY_019219 [Phlomoides rotata]
MAGSMVDADQENNLAENRREEEDDDKENEEETANASILAGLNLVMIMSLLSLSEEECSSFDEIKDIETRNEDRKAKQGVPKPSLQTQRQQVNQFPALERQSTRVHTKIRDSRHCRRF